MLPLAFVILAPVLLFGTVTVLAFLFFGMIIVRPWFAETFEGRTPWWKRLAGFALKWATRKLRAIELRLTAELGQHFAQMSPAVSRWLHRQARTMEQLSGVIVASNEAAYKAFARLRHETIPALLEAKVQPIWNRIAALSERLGVTEGRIQDAGQLVTGTLRLLPWGAPLGFVPALDSFLDSYRHLWRQFFDFAQPQLNELRNVVIPDIWRRLADLESGAGAGIGAALRSIRRRLTELETGLASILSDPTTWVLTALGLAALPALSSGGMRTALRNLTCRNTQSVARNVCAMDEALLAELLAGTLLWALVLDPRVIAQSGQAVLGGMESIWRETALR